MVLIGSISDACFPLIKLGMYLCWEDDFHWGWIFWREVYCKHKVIMAEMRWHFEQGFIILIIFLYCSHSAEYFHKVIWISEQSGQSLEEKVYISVKIYSSRDKDWKFIWFQRSEVHMEVMHQLLKIKSAKKFVSEKTIIVNITKLLIIFSAPFSWELMTRLIFKLINETILKI